VSGEAGAAAVARAPQSAASIDDPRVQPVLLVLRAGASDCERPRPDGVMRLMSVVASAAVQRVGCTELELASLPARFVNVFETITEAGVLLLRALDGHEPSLRVQPRLQLVPDPSPPSILFFGSTFREWNAVRSNGVGAGRTPPGPIFLSAHPPPLGAKPLGAKLGSLAAAPAPRLARKFLATRAAAHRENMLSEGLSFLLVSVRPSTDAGLGVAAHMQSVSSCQGCCGETARHVRSENVQGARRVKALVRWLAVHEGTCACARARVPASRITPCACRLPPAVNACRLLHRSLGIARARVCEAAGQRREVCEAAAEGVPSVCEALAAKGFRR
jgi:hypothetical protein